MNLHEFLELCDPNMKVAITNENGIGGASYLAWPEGDWTVKQAMDELACGAYHVVGFEVRDGLSVIYADENPWCFGSYWEDEDGKDYVVEMHCEVKVHEATDGDAATTAYQMLANGDVMMMYDVREAFDDPEDIRGLKERYEWTRQDTEDYEALMRKRAFWDVMSQAESRDGGIPFQLVDRVVDAYLEKLEGQYYRDSEWEDCGDAISEVLGDE